MQSSKEWQRLSTSSCTTCSSCSLADASDACAPRPCQLRYSLLLGALRASCKVVLPVLSMHNHSSQISHIESICGAMLL